MGGRKKQFGTINFVAQKIEKQLQSRDIRLDQVGIVDIDAYLTIKRSNFTGD